jgi:hypothetical protein
MRMKPKFVSRVIGNRFEVFDNKIVYRRGFWPFKKVITIPLARIASVEKPQFTGRLIVETTGGKVHKFPLGMKAGKAKEVIEELL